MKCSLNKNSPGKTALPPEEAKVAAQEMQERYLQYQAQLSAGVPPLPAPADAAAGFVPSEEETRGHTREMSEDHTSLRENEEASEGEEGEDEENADSRPFSAAEKGKGRETGEASGGEW